MAEVRQRLREVIDGTRVDGEPHAVTITPPPAPPSTPTGADSRTSLIVQDAGLHHHCRTMGFSFP
jgi:hypothetical protein